jgi:endonuclease/exonuclease/phosphatase family metal-dependent hydrolase
MKKLLSLLLSIVLIQYGSIAQNKNSYTIGTYNIRFDNPRDTGNEWVSRRPAIEALIRFHDFDILGTQEGLYHQLQGLDSSLTDHVYVGVGRTDSLKAGEFSAIFYKRSKFDERGKGDFWLSATPEKPGLGWDARIPRICSWVKLRDKSTKKEFFVFNAHFDHQGVVARNESSKLILQKIRSIAGNSPVIFMGDLNTTQKEESYLTIANSAILKDAFGLTSNPYMLNGTFNGFDIKRKTPDRIDHVFVSKAFTVQRWGVLTDSFAGRLPSDHYPVLVEVAIR